MRILKGFSKLRPAAGNIIPREFVSIIIPFRNEEKNIIANLKSIEAQLYPQEKFEVIYVDDCSDDASGELLKNNIKNNNIRVIKVPNEFSKNAHKKRAIRYGIENAKGEIIITTDADCTHNEEWLISMLEYFDSLTGFVSGPVEFESGNSIFSKFQKLEFAGLVICGAGLIGSGHPTICNAANIAYRKKVYEEVGGFKDHMNMSSGDDELLMQKISKDSDFNVKFCFDKRAIVKTQANRSIKEFLHQRRRWASKGLFYSDKTLVLKLLLIYSFYLGLVLQIIFGLFFHSFFLISFLVSMILKIIVEFRVLSKGIKILFSSLQLRYLFIAEILQIPYIVFIGLLGSFGNYVWKDRKLRR